MHARVSLHHAGQRKHRHSHPGRVELSLVISYHRAEGAGPSLPGSDSLSSLAQASIHFGITCKGELQGVGILQPQHLKEEATYHFWDELLLMAQIGH